jgi:hypothetical protein
MKNKIISVVVSVVIAFALWTYVITTVSPESEEHYYDIPVTYQNDILEERGLMIVSETPTVDLKLKGNRSDLNELNANNITVLVDLAAIQAPGTQMLTPKVIYPGNMAVETISQNPNVLQLKVENRIKKPVPIHLEFLGAVPEGFIADKDNPVMDTAVVEVVGPQSSMDLIDHATIQVDLNDKTESIVGAFQYVLCDEAGEPVDAEMVTTNVEEVNLSVKIQAIKEVPLSVKLIDGGGATSDSCEVELTRDSIWVSGSESRLRDLEVVELGTVDLATLNEESNTIVFEIVLPEGVTNMTGETEVTATISFPDLTRKKLTISKNKFVTTGVPEGAEVVWITEMVEVELRGPSALMKNLSEKDITVSVDFTGEELGGVSKVPKITLGSGYSEVGAISVSAVTATLQLEEPDETTG